METKDFNVKEPIHVSKETMNKIPTTERKISVTYTIKRLKETIIKLSKAKMITKEEGEQLSKIYNDIFKREQGEELKL